MTGSPNILWGRLTSVSLLALGLALAIGVYGHTTGSAAVGGLAGGLAPLGTVWVSALRMTVIPLVVTQLLTAFSGAPGEESLGAVGGRTLAVMVTYLAVAGLLTLVAVAPVVELYSVDPASATALRATTTIPQAALDAVASAPATLGEWFQELVPQNVFAALVAGDILPVLLFTAVFGLAVSRLPTRRARVSPGSSGAWPMRSCRWSSGSYG